ncbi:MAG: 1-acyl-sn-glycerol-3-phosphate acyltransferase [Candidatus Tectomicrobia bacterium]
MTESVALPVWLVSLLGFLAVWAVLDRLLVPSLRWFMRQRTNRLINEINTRLRIEIQPFQWTKRQVLIDRLMYDPKVQEVAEAYAREHGMPRQVVMTTIRRYAQEIVPAFNAYLYFRFGYWLSRRIARLLYRVRLAYADEAGLAAIPTGASVVFVMNHRSNMDYILVGYLAADRTTLSYAVGEWARIWPLQTLIRAMGAYFVRRDSHDRLYRRVLERYVCMATAAGVPQAMYPEGGLSRNGALRAPKLGLLDYMLRGFDSQDERDLVFVPVGINYDRTLEDRTLLRVQEPGASKRGAIFAMATTVRFLLHNLRLMLQNRWYRFGYACVTFGAPISMRAYLAQRALDFHALPREERFARVEQLGQELMAAVGAVIPVLPVSLVATVFVQPPHTPLSELELKARVHSLMCTLETQGAHLYIPRQDQDYAITVGLRALTLRHLVTENDGLYAAQPHELAVLRYYANSIAHLLPLRQSDPRQSPPP